MKLSFRIKKTVEFIFDYLSDMQKFASVHPVISQIEGTGTDSYLVHETLKFGFLPFSFTYPVTVEKNTLLNVVIVRATVFKLTKIEMKFILKKESNYTLIEENIQFSSPLPIRLIMQRIFRKQHEQLFRNIEMK